jgi:hypothetical protein
VKIIYLYLWTIQFGAAPFGSPATCLREYKVLAKNFPAAVAICKSEYELGHKNKNLSFECEPSFDDPYKIERSTFAYAICEKESK